MKPVLASWGTMCLWGMALGTAQAAGFALIEQNASGLGNAYAGQAAVAEDASTVFFNPAGMSRLDGRQLVAAAHAILPSAEFADSGSTLSLNQATLGGNGGDAGTLALAPNLYYVMPLGERMRFGLGISAPFGLVTEYDPNWAGRFHAVKSDLQTININPSLAYKIDDTWSVGLGINAQQVKAELSKMANYGAAGAPFANLEGLATVKGDDWGWGYNLGILYEPRADLRIGFSYRSKIDYTLEGTVTYGNRPIALAGVPSLQDGPVTAKTAMPASASLSLYKVLSPGWDLLADASWTQWNAFDRLTVRRTSALLVDDTLENWHNTWRFSLGANRHVCERMTWRFGLAFDESPIPDATRTPRIPDADRFWLALGLQYRMDRKRTLDVGYTHIFVDNSRINILPTATVGALVGDFENKIDILSAQYTHNF
jgi:long-chain fatty acid transport protein